MFFLKGWLDAEDGWSDAYFHYKMDRYSFDKILQKGAFGVVWAGIRRCDNLPVSNEKEKSFTRYISYLYYTQF